MKSELKIGLDLIRWIGNEGFEAYIVGGAVRDYVMGNHNPHDVDVATNCPPSILEYHWKVHPIGNSRDFGIFNLMASGAPETWIEVAQFRSDGNYKDGRRPETVEIVDSLEADVARRDFTINGLAMDADRNIIDHVGGQKDIKDGVIRAIGNAADRIEEDYLRILRAFRFAATFGFEMNRYLKRAIYLFGEKIAQLPRERIKDELWKMAGKGGPVLADALEKISESGTRMLGQIAPGIAHMNLYGHNPLHHPEGGVWEHTLAALRKSRSEDPLVNMAILYHDIGKPLTLTEDKTGFHYYGHDKEGAEAIRGEYIREGLCLSNNEVRAMAFCCEHHMRALRLKKKSKIVELVGSKYWPILKEVLRADILSRGLETENEVEAWILNMEEDAREWTERMEDEERLNFVSGDRIMEVGGIEQGPLVGKVKQEINEWIVDEGIDPEDWNQIDRKIKEVCRC